MTTETEQISAADTVGRVVEQLRTLVAPLPSQDGVAVFGAMYLTVTEAIRTDLLTAGHFRAPDEVARLDVLFSGRFLAAVQAPRAPACWRPLLELRMHPRVFPIQFALAGMNAHVEHDLPLAVLDTCAALGCAPQELSVDFHRVNDVLAQVEAQVRESLMPSLEELDAAEPLLHLLGSWSIDRARDAAWAGAVSLWELRGVPAAYAVAGTALDDATGLVSRCLLTPLRSPVPVR